MATVAEQLRHAREAKGLALAEVVEVIQLKTDQVQALEGGRFEEFAAPAYVRGFVRSYANMLKLDTEALLAQLMGHLRPRLLQLLSKLAGETVVRFG